MGKKKSFTTSALASLTGQSTSVAQPTPVVEESETTKTKIETVEPQESKPKTSDTKAAVSTPAKKAPAKRFPKKKKPTGLQDPNKRSVKKSHTPVTLYLNATNLEKLKEHAEQEEQKISWLIDEMIYDYLSDVIE